MICLVAMPRFVFWVWILEGEERRGMVIFCGLGLVQGVDIKGEGEDDESAADSRHDPKKRKEVRCSEQPCPFYSGESLGVVSKGSGMGLQRFRHAHVS